MKQIYEVSVVGISVKGFAVHAENQEQAKLFAEKIYRDSDLIGFDKDSLDIVDIQAVPICEPIECCEIYGDE